MGGPNYDDALISMYYGDHKIAKNAEKVAKTKYIALEDKELKEIGHSNDESIMLRRRLRFAQKSDATKCHWYNDAKACVHIHPLNRKLLTVSVGVNEADKAKNGYFGAEYEDYGDYDKYGDFDINDMNEIYANYMQEQQALYNELWANYLRNLNNLYWQQNAANAYNGYDNNYYGVEVDSDDKEEDEEGTEGGGRGEGAEEAGFGISENSIMEKAESEARKHVEARIEKRMEGRLEKEMMSHLNSNRRGKVHHKRQSDYIGHDMDAEHGGMPMDEMDAEEDQNEEAPHDSLSDSH